MVQWDIAIIWKVLLITATSFTLTVAIYWFLIRPFNVLRFVFGMKWITKESQVSSSQGILSPIVITDKNEACHLQNKNIKFKKSF